ncbi:MAG: response regulator, partial [Deltaproteobacteria bacterium]
TPLNSIIGFSGILLDGLAGELNEEQKKQLTIINDSGKHLLQLINDILDLSKIDAGRMQLEPEPCSLGTIIENVVGLVSPLAASKGLDLRVQTAEIDLFQDVMKLKQILLNVLSNAVKFTEQGSISIRASEAGGLVTIEIEDTGRGIAAEDLEHIFDEFKQVGATHASQPGTGLGLALCRRITAMMKGEISVRSEEGKGSVFTIRVPARIEPESEQQGESTLILPEDFDPARPSVLAIDDDVGMLELVRQYLQGAGMQYILAADSRVGLKAAREYRPDVILLDILMPEMNGWEVLSALKCDDTTKSIPVICISVLEDRETAHAMGASQFLVKPVLREDLLEAIGKLQRKDA